MRTRSKTPPFSLSDKVSITVPASWAELTDRQLRYALRLLWLHGEAPGWQYRVRVAALLHYGGIEVVRRTDTRWLCRECRTGNAFLLSADLLPSLTEAVAWITDTAHVGARIARIDGHEATDFHLRTLPFGEYLEAENLYQSFLQSRSEDCLARLTAVLYRSEEPTPGMKEEVLTGTFLWYTSAKQLLAAQFPHFLRPSSASDGNAAPVTRERLLESMRAQIRLLTKGDVTKQQYILEQTDTWTALAELDAQAREAEEIKKKYGKRHL